jgi:hypothetical protein
MRRQPIVNPTISYRRLVFGFPNLFVGVSRCRNPPSRENQKERGGNDCIEAHTPQRPNTNSKADDRKTPMNENVSQSYGIIRSTEPPAIPKGSEILTTNARLSRDVLKKLYRFIKALQLGQTTTSLWARVVPHNEHIRTNDFATTLNIKISPKIVPNGQRNSRRIPRNCKSEPPTVNLAFFTILPFIKLTKV